MDHTDLLCSLACFDKIINSREYYFVLISEQLEYISELSNDEMILFYLLMHEIYPKSFPLEIEF